jgi:hypothetical protein
MHTYVYIYIDMIQQFDIYKIDCEKKRKEDINEKFCTRREKSTTTGLNKTQRARGTENKVNKQNFEDI